MCAFFVFSALSNTHSTAQSKSDHVKILGILHKIFSKCAFSTAAAAALHLEIEKIASSAVKETGGILKSKLAAKEIEINLILNGKFL